MTEIAIVFIVLACILGVLSVVFGVYSFFYDIHLNLLKTLSHWNSERIKNKEDSQNGKN